MKNVPKLRNLYLYVTNGCNLNCKHCWIDGCIQNKDFIDYDLLKSIAPNLEKLGLTKVNLTGGEPTLHPRLLDIIKLFHDYGMSQFLSTNGTMLTENFCSTVSEYESFGCSISLDGASSSTHDKIRGVDGAFKKTINGIRNLVKYHISFEVVFTIQESNFSELKDIIELAESIGVPGIRINFLLYGGGDRIKQLQAEEGKMGIKDIINCKKTFDKLNDNTSIKILTNLPFSFYEPQEILALKGRVCGMMNSIGLLPNGNISICGVGELRDELIIGKASSGKIEEIWENNDILKKIRCGIPDKLEGVCSICNLKSICRGCCIAQNYLENGSFFSAYSLCEMMYKENLFPQKYLNIREFAYED